MLEVFFAANAEGDPTGVARPFVFFSKAVSQKGALNGEGEGNIDDPAGVDVAKFRARKPEFPSAEAMRPNRDMGPSRNHFFELCQMFHVPRGFL